MKTQECREGRSLSSESLQKHVPHRATWQHQDWAGGRGVRGESVGPQPLLEILWEGVGKAEE